jgi:hypothetical protein
MLPEGAPREQAFGPLKPEAGNAPKLLSPVSLSQAIPERGLFLTAGVNVHKDRIEVEVVAWGRNEEIWSVDSLVIDGDSARPEVWQKLDAVLARDWPHASGQSLPIRVMCVDAGYATQDVYAWVRRHPQAGWGPAGSAARQPRTAAPVKGRDQDTALRRIRYRHCRGIVRPSIRPRQIGGGCMHGNFRGWVQYRKTRGGTGWRAWSPRMCDRRTDRVLLLRAACRP